MYTYFKIGIILFFLGSLASFTSAQTDKMLFNFEGAFDVNNVKKNNAQVAITRW